MKEKKTFLYSGFILGILFVLSGVGLVIYSFRDEVLENKYIVEKSTEYVSKKKDLHKGEFSVTKNVDYVLKGRYKITYKIDYKQASGNVLFADKSKITITDIFGDGYKMDTNEIFINNDPIKLYSSSTVTSDYEMSYNNNTFEVVFPKDKVVKYNKIVVYVELKERAVNTEYITSKEAFYTFVPSIKNSYYEKKSMQSYSIEGTGSIVLKNKQ